jgi:putative endopeptidase
MRAMPWLAVILSLLPACARQPLLPPAPVAAVGAPAPASTPAPAPTPAPRPAIGDFGLDLTGRDLSVRPGDDFFRYANGSWYDRFNIPGDHASYGAFYELDELSKQRVRAIIERAAAAHAAPGSPEQQIGDFYASYMDRATIESRGLEPARADLERIAHASRAQLARLFGLPGFPSLFDVDLTPDYHNPDRYAVYLSESSLGLPDRDYYLKDDAQLRALRVRYQAYIAQILELGGASRAQAAALAPRVLAFETAAARAQWPIERRRNVDLTWNPRTRQELRRYAPGFPWQPFFESLDLGDRQQLVLAELSAIRDLARLFQRTPLATLRAWLTFQYLSSQAQYLPQRFDAANFAFYGQALRSQPEQQPRWKRGVEQVNWALGDAVGRLYVAAYFPPASKAKMQQLVADLLAALSERLDALDWMTPETKARAHQKLAAFTVKIGYPETWKDYGALSVRRDDLMGNVRRAEQWQWDYKRARLDRPVDRGEWEMCPQDIDAYYNASNNEIVFPAGILQPPFFDPNADAAVNYGAIGAIIGHEIGHGFDDQGRKFGPHGALEDWWTAQDVQVFSARTARLAEEYSGFQVLPGLHVNGSNTIGENIGDLGGLNMAHEAYRISLGGRSAPLIDGLSGDQRFFLAWAQTWREKDREAMLREMVLSDVHAPASVRVNGPLPNMDAWYAAFDVRPGDKLYLPPAERVRIW